MVSKILIALLFMCSIAYADMKYITIEDANDHSKLVTTINKLIERANQDKSDNRADKKEFRQANKYQIGLDNKIVKKMVNKGWIAQHSEVEP